MLIQARRPSAAPLPAKGNVISGNARTGSQISQDDNECTIQGNRIGTDAAGTAALGNGGIGIAINDTEFCVIGGTSAGRAQHHFGQRLQRDFQLTDDASVRPSRATTSA